MILADDQGPVTQSPHPIPTLIPSRSIHDGIRCTSHSRHALQQLLTHVRRWEARGRYLQFSDSDIYVLMQYLISGGYLAELWVGQYEVRGEQSVRVVGSEDWEWWWPYVGKYINDIMNGEMKMCFWERWPLGERECVSQNYAGGGCSWYVLSKGGGI